MGLDHTNALPCIRMIQPFLNLVMSTPLRRSGVKVAHYKSFGEEPQGFDEILPINLIIGRNNSGKSALIDVISASCLQGPQTSQGRLPSLPGSSRGGFPTNVVAYGQLPDGIGGTRQPWQSLPEAWPMPKHAVTWRRVRPANWHQCQDFWDDCLIAIPTHGEAQLITDAKDIPPKCFKCCILIKQYFFKISAA